MARCEMRVSMVMVAVALAACGKGGEAGPTAPPAAAKAKPAVDGVYAQVVEDIDGNEVKLSQYAGKAMLIVNVASQCGFTPQYEGLQKLHETYADKGLVVMGFPSNDFGGQEPGTEAEIKGFATGRFGVTFPLFSKSTVKGEAKSSLFRTLTSASGDGEVGWNFTKFLVDRKGRVAARFDSKVAPDDPALRKKIDEVLAAN